MLKTVSSLDLQGLVATPIFLRISELKDVRPEATWAEVWDLHVREVEDDTVLPDLVREVLWRARLGRWLKGLKEGACEACGRPIAGERRTGSLYCAGGACAQAALRARKALRFTDLGEAVELGSKLLAWVDMEVNKARRFATSLRATDPTLAVSPPDWLTYADLPEIPSLGCGERCDGNGMCGFSRARGCVFRNTPNMLEGPHG